MVLDATSALGAMTGARFIESLKDGREVWLDGEKVQDELSIRRFPESPTNWPGSTTFRLPTSIVTK